MSGILCNNASQRKLWCAYWGAKNQDATFFWNAASSPTLSLKGPRVWQLSPDYQCREGPHLRGSTLPSCHGEGVSWCGATILLPRSGGNPQFVQDPKRHTDHPEKRRGVPHGEACLRQQQATNVVPTRTTWAFNGSPCSPPSPYGMWCTVSSSSSHKNVDGVL